ncbi:MAG: dioxygenase [Acidimicrobiales bacterium]
MTTPSGPEGLTAQVISSFGATPDPRLRFLLERMVHHLHAFAAETRLTEGEWATAVEFLTAVGQRCTPQRQELILLSDTLGLSMLVDLLNNGGAPSSTESTVLGPFYVPESPRRPMGSSIIEQEGSGAPTRVSGTVRDVENRPLEGALLDVWQNASNQLYAVEDPGQPPENLRGRFSTGPDGRYWFWSARPTDYRIPVDGPVGRMMEASGRSAWRPAHLHVIVSAPGHRTVTTHFFDDESPHLDSDAVFGVKPSLLCHFEEHGPDEPGAPDGLTGAWYTMERDIVLTPTGS